MKKILIITFLLIVNIYAKNTNLSITNNEIFLLPKQGKEIKDEITSLIKSSQQEILIAMYNFSYKKFAKELISASKKGVNITVILDEEKVSKNKKIYKELINNGIKAIISNKKMHLKIAIFDKSYLLIGSANWTKESFKDNYEIILKTNDNKIIDKISKELYNF